MDSAPESDSCRHVGVSRFWSRALASDRARCRFPSRLFIEVYEPNCRIIGETLRGRLLLGLLQSPESRIILLSLNHLVPAFISPPGRGRETDQNFEAAISGRLFSFGKAFRRRSESSAL